DLVVHGPAFLRAPRVAAAVPPDLLVDPGVADAFARPVERVVHRDAEEPGGELALELEVPELSVDLDEELLDQVRGGVVFADDPVRRGEYLFPVLFIERAEGIGVPGQVPSHQV